MFVQVILCLMSFVSYISLCGFVKCSVVYVSCTCGFGIWQMCVMLQNKAILFMYHSTNREEHVPAIYSP